MTNAEKDMIFSLEDPVDDLKQYAARLNCMLDDLIEYYFEFFDPTDKDEVALIVHGFKKNAVRAAIALDAFCHMRDSINTISGCLDKAIEQRNAETGGKEVKA